MGSSQAGPTAPGAIYQRAEWPGLSAALALVVDYLHDVLDIYATGDQFSASSSHGLEQLLALHINEGHFAQIDHTSPQIATAPRALPTPLKLRNPRRNQAALQDPPSLNGAIADHDPQRGGAGRALSAPR